MRYEDELSNPEDDLDWRFSPSNSGTLGYLDCDSRPVVI
jgi:hypothetical protein